MAPSCRLFAAVSTSWWEPPDLSWPQPHFWCSLASHSCGLPLWEEENSAYKDCLDSLTCRNDLNPWTQRGHNSARLCINLNLRNTPNNSVFAGTSHVAPVTPADTKRIQIPPGPPEKPPQFHVYELVGALSFPQLQGLIIYGAGNKKMGAHWG